MVYTEKQWTFTTPISVTMLNKQVLGSLASKVTQCNGSGWFSRLFSRAIVPSLKFMGLRGLDLASNVVSDVIDGQNVGESIKTRSLNEAKNIGKIAAGKAKAYVASKTQTGSGKKLKKKASPNSKTTKKITKKGYKSGVHKMDIDDFLK